MAPSVTQLTYCYTYIYCNTALGSYRVITLLCNSSCTDGIYVTVEKWYRRWGGLHIGMVLDIVR